MLSCVSWSATHAHADRVAPALRCRSSAACRLPTRRAARGFACAEGVAAYPLSSNTLRLSLLAIESRPMEAKREPGQSSTVAPLMEKLPSRLTFDMSRFATTPCRCSSPGALECTRALTAPDAAVCVINERVGHGRAFRWSHSNIGHAAQYLFKCWSWFDLFPQASRILWVQIIGAYGYRMPWATALVSAMNATWIGHATRAPACAALWAVPTRYLWPGWGESFFASVTSAQRLSALVLPRAMPRHEQSRGLMVGVSNRADERRWVGAEAFVASLRARLPSGVAGAASWSMHNKTLREQIDLIRSHDVLIAPRMGKCSTRRPAHAPVLRQLRPANAIPPIWRRRRAERQLCLCSHRQRRPRVVRSVSPPAESS